MVNRTNFEPINLDDFNHDPINQATVQSYPPELVGRFNSFIVTAFDDSMTVEMQIRTMIKWVKENIDVTMSALDNMEAFKQDSTAFQNHVKDTLVTLINQFTSAFDDNLQFEMQEILKKWDEEGYLQSLINEYTNDRMDVLVANKISKGQVTMSDLTQDVKEILVADKISKGEVKLSDLTQEVKEVLNGDRPLPIVGEGSVGTPNLIDKSVIYQKIGDKAVAIDKLSQDLQDKMKFNIKNIIGLDVTESLYQWANYDAAGWNGSSERLALIPNVNSIQPRMVRTTPDIFIPGHKYFLSCDFKVTSYHFRKVEIGLYSSNDTTMVKLTTYQPQIHTWQTLDGVVTGMVGDGDIMVQISGFMNGNQTDTNIGELHLRNVVVVDLTESFGLGYEPNTEDFRAYLKSKGGYFLKTHTSDVANSNMNTKVTKGLVDRDVKVVNSLPVNRNKFDDDVINLFSHENQNLSTHPKGAIEWVTLNGDKYLHLIPRGDGDGNATAESYIGGKNLSNIKYIDVEVYVKDPSKIKTFAINLNANGYIIYGVNQQSHLKASNSEGVRNLRIPVSEFLKFSGNTNNVTHIQMVVTGSGSEIYIKSVNAIYQSKGTVYMYFDDADLTQYTNGFRIMEKYGLRGTIAVPTKWVGQSFGVGGKKVEWSHLREMQQAGWLVAGHGWDEKSLGTLTDDEAYQNMKNMSDDLFSRGFYFGSKCMISPQGSFNVNTLKMAKKVGLHLIRTNGYPNDINGNSTYTGAFPQNDPFNQKYRSPTASRPVEEIKGWIDEAIATGKETAIAWHVISDTLQWEYANTTAYFEEIVKYVKQKQDEGLLRVVTWEDTMIQSHNTKPIDTDGNMFITTDDGMPTIIDLRN